MTSEFEKAYDALYDDRETFKSKPKSGMDIGAAIECLREGKRVARFAWSRSDERPMELVLVPGREIVPTFEPMLSVTKGAKFHTDDHIDAVYVVESEDPTVRLDLRILATLNYQFTQYDVLATDWYVRED